MSNAYLEDLKIAIETAIQFEFFVKFKEKSTFLKPTHNAKPVQQKKPTETPKQRAKVPQKDAKVSQKDTKSPQQDAPKPNIVLRNENPTQLKLQANEYSQNFLKVKDGQILMDNEALIDESKTPQEAPTLKKFVNQNSVCSEIDFVNDKQTFAMGKDDQISKNEKAVIDDSEEIQQSLVMNPIFLVLQ
ncbi:hypothetical protein CsSME_00006773 [Camellia sinensis var. sinensis]